VKPFLKFFKFVMPGLVPGIHVLLFTHVYKDVDGWAKPGHDGAYAAKDFA
jgi:hypothetical protein